MPDLTQPSTQPDAASARLLASVQQRGLTTPALLVLAGHRPLAFVAGQMLYAAAPLCALIGWDGASAWAAALSAPDAWTRAAAALETAQSVHGEGRPHVVE
jgi:hypothetical protein